MKIKVVLSVFVVLIVFGLGGSTYYFYNKYNESKKMMSNPQALVDQQGAEVLNRVAKLMDLPNENPTIATVLDAEKLKDQEFFANAQNDDRVLIFASAKKAVLYRPSTNKIINVSPLNIGNPTVSPTPTQTKKVVKEETTDEASESAAR